jgi:hypothetical protein
MTVGIDYHIEVDVWYSWQHVSIVSQGEVLAIHPRLHRPGQDSTLPEYMPRCQTPR